jgi:hypothetical protein
MKQIHREEIHWVDTERTNEWLSLDSIQLIQALPVIRSLGFVVVENDQMVILAQSYDEKNQTIDGELRIPAGTIINRKEIEECKVNPRSSQHG